MDQLMQNLSLQDNFPPLQPQHQQTLSQRTTTETPPRRLPLELWIQIFESLTHENHTARPAYIACFVAAVFEQGPATELSQAARLPDLEFAAWKATLPYYAIDRQTRRAARHAFLSAVLLRTCSPPLTSIPLLRKNVLTPTRRLASTPPLTTQPQPQQQQQTYAPSLLLLMAPQPNRRPTRLTLELYPQPTYESLVGSTTFAGTHRGSRWGVRLAALAHMWGAHRARLLDGARCDLLLTVRRVELLAGAPEEGLEEVAWEGAEEMKGVVEGVWRGMGVLGVVGIWE